MYNLTIEQVKELAKDYSIIPLVTEVRGDMDTPISVFKRMAAEKECFLLESIGNSLVTARYSFIGRNPFLMFSGTGSDMEIRYFDGRTEKKTGRPMEELERLVNM